MMHLKRIKPIVKLTLKLQCKSQVYAIIVMHMKRRELKQLQEHQQQNDLTKGIKE